MIFWFAILVCLIAVIMLNWQQYFRTTNQGKVALETYREGLSPPYLIRVAEKREPLIIRNSPALKWKANDRWTFDTDDGRVYLKKIISELSSVYCKNFSMDDDEYPFIYEDRNKGAFEFEPDHSKIPSMPVDEFLNRVMEKEPKPVDNNQVEVLYWTNTIPEQLENDMQPKLFREGDLQLGKVRSKNLWIGRKGVTSTAHYDTQHNFFYQLVGSKRFRLLPPLKAMELGFYPEGHARDRQCLETSLTGDIFETVVRPGDLLYFPPFWAHEVTALNHSISVNIWYDSNESDFAESLTESLIPEPLRPFPNKADPKVIKAAMPMRLALLTELVAALTHAVFKWSLSPFDVWRGDPHNLLNDPMLLNATLESLSEDFVRNFVLSRYILEGLDCAQFNTAKCTVLPPIDEIPDQLLNSLSPILEKLGRESIEFSRGIRDTHENNQQTIRKAHNHVTGVIKIVLATWIEKLVGYVVGAKNICKFLRCFLDKKHVH